MLEIRKYDEKAKRALAEARSLMDLAAREGRDLTTDEEQRFHAFHDEAELAVKMRERLKEQERIEGADLEQREAARRERVRRETARTPEDTKAEYRSAFMTWLRGGAQDLTTEQRSMLSRGYAEVSARELADPIGGLGLSASDEKRFLGTSGAGTPFGGFAIPEDFSGGIERTMKQFAAILEAPLGLFNTSGGGPFQWPTSDDTAQTGALLAEGNAASANDVVLGRVTFGSYTYTSGLVLVQNQLLQDEEANLEAVLAEALGERLGRITGTHYVTGNGTSQPQGITIGASNSSVSPAWSVAGPDPDADNLIDLMHTIDPAWRGSPAFGFMFHDDALKIIRKLKTSGSGEPVWQLGGLAAGAPATILGKPYWAVNDMPTPGTATNRAFVVGDFRRFRVRRVGRIILMRLAERYAEFFQTGFVAFYRTDSKVTQSAALKYVAMAA